MLYRIDIVDEDENDLLFYAINFAIYGDQNKCTIDHLSFENIKSFKAEELNIIWDNVNGFKN